MSSRAAQVLALPGTGAANVVGHLSGPACTQLTMQACKQTQNSDGTCDPIWFQAGGKGRCPQMIASSDGASKSKAARRKQLIQANTARQTFVFKPSSQPEDMQMHRAHLRIHSLRLSRLENVRFLLTFLGRDSCPDLADLPCLRCFSSSASSCLGRTLLASVACSNWLVPVALGSPEPCSTSLQPTMGVCAFPHGPSVPGSAARDTAVASAARDTALAGREAAMAPLCWSGKLWSTRLLARLEPPVPFSIETSELGSGSSCRLRLRALSHGACCCGAWTESSKL